jgi:hypothetical protein
MIEYTEMVLTLKDVAERLKDLKIDYMVTGHPIRLRRDSLKILIG